MKTNIGKTDLLVMKATGQAMLGRKVYVVAKNEQEVDFLRRLFRQRGGKPNSQNQSLRFGRGQVSFLTSDSHLVDKAHRRIIGVPMPDTFFDSGCF